MRVIFQLRKTENAILIHVLCSPLPPFKNDREKKLTRVQWHKSCLYCYFQMVPYWNVASSIKTEGSTDYNSKQEKARQANRLTHCRQHKCDLCSKTFLHRGNMLRHKKEEHLGIFNHRCQICKKGFSNKGDLEGHLVSHGAQRHACTSCGKSYAYRYDLRKHMMNSHWYLLFVWRELMAFGFELDTATRHTWLTVILCTFRCLWTLEEQDTSLRHCHTMH